MSYQSRFGVTRIGLLKSAILLRVLSPWPGRTGQGLYTILGMCLVLDLSPGSFLLDVLVNLFVPINASHNPAAWIDQVHVLVAARPFVIL